MASISLTAMLARATYTDISTLNSLRISKQSFLAAEAFAEEVAQRHVFGTYSIDTYETLNFGAITGYATSTIDLVNDVLTIEAQGTIKNVVRKVQIVLSIGTGSAFNYGLQAGNGGITLANSSRIIGNVYSNGPVSGSGNSSEVLGDVVSAGSAGYLFDIHTTGSAWANTIEDSDIDGELNTESVLTDITNVVGPPDIRNYYGPGNDLATTSFPIADDLVAEWKQSIEDTGTVIPASDPDCLDNGIYTIDDPATLGNVKIECDLEVKHQGNPPTVLTLTGPIWVEGSIELKGPDIRVTPSLGRRSVQIIADNESDRTTSSKIKILTSSDFYGSGDSRSYIMLLSMNNAAENSNPDIAIDVAQSADGSLIVYAGHGLIEVGNGVDLKEITAYQINVAQNSEITYESGLQDLIFTSGPGGGYSIDDWSETY